MKTLKEKGELLFRGIEEERLAPTLHCIGAKRRSFRKDDIIYKAGEDILEVGLILEGAIHMVHEDLWGNQNLITRMGEGDLIGEIFACGFEHQSNVSFIADSPVELLLLPFPKVLHVCTTHCIVHHQLIENMVGMFAKKGRKLLDKLEVTTPKGLREKLLAYLSLEASRAGSTRIVLPYTREELATYLGVNRSALSREFSRLREEGFLEFDGRTVSLLETRE